MKLPYWFTCHTPGAYEGSPTYGTHTFFDHLSWTWRRFVKRMPLLTLFRPWWWNMIYNDLKTGQTCTCQCGKTWWKYRVLPAIVGDGRFGGGC